MASVFTKTKNVFVVLYLTVVLSFYVKPILGAFSKIEDEPANEMHDVEAVQGTKAKLPCDIMPSLAGDKMNIAIWYKDIRTSPLFTFDSRDKDLEIGSFWVDDTVLGDRATFRYQEKPAKLILNNVKDSDGGIYQCRVDFKQSPTRNVKVNLTIIIPPEKVSILDERGVHIPHYILGPYNEGASINITCVATGGRPYPTVTWWLENTRLDTTYEVLSERRVRNVLHLEKLERKHLHSVFTCQATNNHLVTPISSSVTLDLNLRPLWVKLLGDNRPLSAETTYELSCEVVGSRPPPTITWWKGSIQMKDTRETTSPDGNSTTSVLTFVPSVDDGGKYLSCRGQQQLIPDSGMEDGWKLDIYHVPLVSLELGSNLNGSIIKEGVDVYFECNIKSNPWVYKVSWRHNGKMLYNNAASGTIVSNQSLVLQSVTRNRAGLYTCIGSNQEGDGESNAVQLDVKFAPICRPGQLRVYGVARHEHAKIPCELETNPVAGLVFSWKFNNSAETIDIPQSHIFTEGSRSIAVYTPMTEMDYGTLLCWGKNEIGVQKEPCIFYINPAAMTPVFLQITPVLGALIGVVVALILVAVIIVIAIRLRSRNDCDDKDYYNGGLSPSGRRCVGVSGDKASTEPLNKDLNSDSVDSLDEKNPDIIPQNNGEDEYPDDKQAFERLNNVIPLRMYSRPSPNNMPHVIYNQQAIPMSVLRRQEPTVYAQIDVSNRMPACLQTHSPPQASSFQGIHHPHLPPYVHRPIRKEQTIMHEGGNEETALINHRDNTALQPLLEVSSTRKPSITSALPAATRF